MTALTTRFLLSPSLRRGAILLSALAAISCGGSQEEPKNAKSILVDEDEELADESGMAMQEFGGMHERKVTSTFKRLQPDLSECLKHAGKSHEYMFGQVQFLVTVDIEGVVLFSQVEQSDLGNYEAERCMLDVLGASDWPKPVGGHKGHARSSMIYDSDEARAPVQWSSSDIEATIDAPGNANKLASCGGGGPFEITAYVATSGKVLSAGIAHTDDTGDETAACLVETVEAMKFPSPGSWRAKVSFRP